MTVHRMLTKVIPNKQQRHRTLRARRNGKLPPRCPVVWISIEAHATWLGRNLHGEALKAHGPSHHHHGGEPDHIAQEDHIG